MTILLLCYVTVLSVCLIIGTVVGAFGIFLDGPNWERERRRLFDIPAKKIFFTYGIGYVIGYWLAGGFQKHD